MSHLLFTTIYVGRRYETSEVEYKPRNAKKQKGRYSWQHMRHAKPYSDLLLQVQRRESLTVLDSQRRPGALILQYVLYPHALRAPRIHYFGVHQLRFFVCLFFSCCGWFSNNNMRQSWHRIHLWALHLEWTCVQSVWPHRSFQLYWFPAVSLIDS